MPSERLVAQVKLWEGFRATPYMDVAGTWSWAYGETNGAHPTAPLTEAEGDLMLRASLAQAEHEVFTLETAFKLLWKPQQEQLSFSAGQLDALTDFVFNVGLGKPGEKDGLIWLKKFSAMGQHQHSTLYRMLKTGNWQAAADEFPKWAYAGGKVQPGLVSRRATEREWFLEGIKA